MPPPGRVVGVDPPPPGGTVVGIVPPGAVVGGEVVVVVGVDPSGGSSEAKRAKPWTATPLIIYLGFFMAVALRAQDLTVRDAATAKASADAATLRKKFTDAQFLLTDERLDLMKSDKLNEIVLKVLHSATKNEPMAGQALLKMLERRAGKPSTEAAMQLILHHGAFDEEPEDSGAQQRAAG